MRKSAKKSAQRARHSAAAATETGCGIEAEAAAPTGAPKEGPQAGEGGARRARAEAELAADLKPQGALERMVVEQMAAAHVATMASFDRAEAAPHGTAPDAAAREIELRLAARFMTLFLRQAATLERRRALARQAERAESRAAFDAALARDHARMTFWEESLRHVEAAAKHSETGGDHGGGDGLDVLGDLEDPDELDGLAGLDDPADVAALAEMASRFGLPSPLDAAGNLDPAALEALVERTGPGMGGELATETAAKVAGG
ncbi:MAG: hypothetical protein OEM59_15875 [Rhodospirillales bacterium]|nr:hypothetical protein [Rhodospirillales bacterium]